MLVTSAKPENETPSRPQGALLCDMELPLREIFYPLGYSVEIITNHQAVLLAARESFGHAHCTRPGVPLQVRIGISDRGEAACPPEPTRREYNHLYSLVADIDNQALLDLRSCTSFAWLGVAAARNRLYLRNNFLEKIVYLLLGASVVTDLHAACIGRNDKGILLCGASGAGKSTLAYACARSGWTYTSDDTSYLINDSVHPRVIGHSHRARFRPSARDLFPELELHELSPRLEGKPSIEVLTAELPVQSTVPETAVHSIVYLKRHPSLAAELSRLPQGTATQRTCKELYSAGEIRIRHELVLKKLVNIPTYELEYSDFEQAMLLLDTLIRDI